MKVVEIDDPKQIVQLFKFGMAIFNESKKAGILKELGDDLEALSAKLSKTTTKNVVKSYESFIEAGMTREQAYELVKLKYMMAIADKSALAKEVSKTIGEALSKTRVETDIQEID